jgi:TIR domain
MPEKKLKIFMSYAHEDEAMKTELDKALVALKKNESIEVWQDRQLLAGQEWDQSIKDELLASDIILLLISVDFNNSKYIWEKELAVAMQRHEKGEARVIPVILRTCDWFDMPYGKLQALPTGGKPVKQFADPDEAYTDIAKGIRGVVEYMLSK